jgi:hypothetical protein
MTAYATLAQVKAALRITDSVDDTLIEMAREAASDLVDGYTGRTFTTSGTVTRVFAPADDYVLQTDDIAGTAVAITSSTGADGVFDVTWKTTDYQLEPLNGVSNGQAVPFTRIRAIQDYLWPTAGGEATVRVTGVYGFRPSRSWSRRPRSCKPHGSSPGSRVRWVSRGSGRWVSCA